MPDEPYPQVRYQRASLTTVVCQLRFHPLLGIAQAAPADFQGKVRGRFPLFSQEHAFQFALAMGQSPSPVVQSLPTPVSWKFESEDEKWSVGLGTESLSLQTTAYTDFREFEDTFGAIADALHSTYGVDKYTRVGLRYINEFAADEFPGSWRTRLQAWLLGPLSSDFGERITVAQQLFSVSTESGTLNVRHGLADGGYRLDLDHAVEGEVGHSELRTCLLNLNEGCYQFFRRSITSEFHNELEPL